MAFAWPASEELFQQVVDALGVPVLTTRLGVDLLPASHPLCFGMPGGIAARSANFTLQNSDFLLTIGTRLDMQMLAYAPDRFARAARKVMVNIDAAEIRKLGKLIDLGIQADAKTFLSELLSLRGQLKPRDRTAWMDRCLQWQARYPFVQAEQRLQKSGISMYAFSDLVGGVAGRRRRRASGQFRILGGNFPYRIQVQTRTTRLPQQRNGSDGAGSTCSARRVPRIRRKRTICVDGDGGFVMNIQELETIRRLQLPIKFFVVNNNGYASIRASQGNYFKLLVGADETSGLSLPDVVRVAHAYGLPARTVARPEELREALKAVLDEPGPGICEVVVLPDEPRVPRVASVIRPGWLDGLAAAGGPVPVPRPRRTA